jgi:Cu(I)-responsive transcriptional regulator
MNIGEASTASGVSAKMIRYYESIGLIQAVERNPAGYRRYSTADVQTLRFLKRARNLGFSVGHMRDLLSLWRDEKRASADVKRLALAHAAALDAKAREIAEMSRALQNLANRCEGDHRPNCPIIDSLAETVELLDGSSTGEATKIGSQPVTPHRPVKQPSHVASHFRPQSRPSRGRH